ncbi:MAG: cobalamin-binding protein [Deltaproteobacteria bacterium]|nr:cobalamin-binding protein [Deltaproteobacteria bacterium]
MRGRPSAPPQRIVSLVPSLSEALFALGLGERVVGVTEWCVHPAEAVARVPKLGGTKNPDLDAIRALAPDLVIANQEENRKRDVERLEAAGIPVWVTYPRTVREGAELFAEMAELGAAAEVRTRVVAPVLGAVQEAEQALAELRASGARPARVFCPIWREPWMAVGAPTYADDLITLCGGENVFGVRDGPRAPRAAAERRYPRVTLAEIEAAQPDVVLLPDEPYAFGPPDAAELSRLDAPFAASGRIHLIDGTFVSWYGPRILRAIELLRRLLLGVTRG